MNRSILLKSFGAAVVLASTTCGCREYIETPQPLREVRQQKRITEPADILDENGAPKTIGWAPGNVARFNRENIPKNEKYLREWEFFTVLTPDYAINFTLANIRFAQFCSVDFIDFKTKKTNAAAAFDLGKHRLTSMTESSRGGASCSKNGAELMRFDHTENERVISFNFNKGLINDEMKGRITLRQPADMDFLAIITPFKEKENAFFYENKIPNLEAVGSVKIGGQELTLPAGRSFAIMDWGRGVWPSKLMWRWGAASGYIDGVPVGFNIGSGFGDDSAASENLIVYDGVGHKIDQVIWHYDTDDFMKPWSFSSNDGRFEMTLEPVYDQSASFDIVSKYGRLNKLYGYFSGSLTLDDGRVIKVEKMLGFAEEVFIGW